ncbi:MAG: FMN-binding protein [Bacteroidaceae bacterium]|nr:FMN-binding protein [Bacteroidaceae bacterium]
MLAVSAFCFTAFVSAQNAASPSDAKPLVKQADGTVVINTTTLAEDVKGYRSTTPLEIYIKSGKIVKVEPLKNQETPKYFVPMKKELLPKFEGLKVNKVATTQIDAVTGATLSSKAVIENVKRGVDYYQKNK